MANIFKTTAILTNLVGAPIPVFTSEEMDAMVGNYWGSLDSERTFPISFWKLEQLFTNSQTHEAALRVTDIANPAAADATWVAFDGSTGNEDAYYFVFNKTYFSGPIELPGTPPASLTGISAAISNAQNGLVVARLGKDDAGEYHAFFKAAQYEMSADSTRTEGSTTGIKIPF